MTLEKFLREPKNRGHTCINIIIITELKGE
jgi:hypothetical protein